MSAGNYVEEAMGAFFKSLNEHWKVDKPVEADGIAQAKFEKHCWEAYRAWAKNNLPEYLREFPRMGWINFDLPKGASDISWHNDTMPSWWLESAKARLWIDLPDIADRETHNIHRFSLYHQNSIDDDMEDLVFETNVWLEIYLFIERRVEKLKR